MIALLNPRLWLAFVIGMAITGSGAYLKGRSDGKAVERAASQQEIDDWRKNAEAAHELYLANRDKKQIEYRTITKTVEAAKHATPTDPICATGDDWMRIYRQNAAIANGTGVPAGAGDADRADAR